MTKKYAIATLMIIVSSLGIHAQNPKLKNAFNGKNLKGWVVPENNIWWTAKDGILSVKSGPDQKGSILWTEKQYSNFIIETEFLMGDGIIDSGIFVRTEDVQIQIGISGSLKRDMTGSPYIPGKGYPVEANGVKELLKLKDWNTFKVEAIGNNYKVWLNGQQVLNYESEDGLVSGPIGLQLHPGKIMAIDFRNIKIAEI
ncbi:MAG: DUF1080 domain-containing protein [Bacteroidetes bacterium]|nr:DUF1080 domain-containing protein [Bacteroidota bacterium]MDA1120603.1 DUF1080 domain-containing protein [Bacteroidota bacterium]